MENQPIQPKTQNNQNIDELLKAMTISQWLVLSRWMEHSDVNAIVGEIDKVIHRFENGESK